MQSFDQSEYKLDLSSPQIPTCCDFIPPINLINLNSSSNCTVEQSAPFYFLDAAYGIIDGEPVVCAGQRQPG